MVSRYTALVVHAAGNVHREDVAAVLTQLGFTVTVVSDFALAKQTVTTNPPDLLITEVRLGAHNGLHLVIAGKAVFPGLAAIAIGGVQDAALRGEAEQAGAILIAGDVDRGVLVETLGTVLRWPLRRVGPERRGRDRRGSGGVSAIAAERRRFVRRRLDRSSSRQDGQEDRLDLAADSARRKR